MSYKITYHDWKEEGFRWTVTYNDDTLTTTRSFATEKECVLWVLQGLD